MKPPGRIFINYELGTNTTKRLNLDDVEYHLAPQWRDAKADPPKKEGTYITTWGKKKKYIAVRSFEQGYWNGEEAVGLPHNWMPLPEPPKEEE